MRTKLHIKCIFVVLGVVVLMVLVDNWLTYYWLDEKGYNRGRLDRARIALNNGDYHNYDMYGSLQNHEENDNFFTWRDQDVGRVVFPKYMFGWSIVRIPALVYHKNVYIAFCEMRAESHGDAGNINIIAKRGHRNRNNQIQWEETMLIAAVPGMRSMCPTPIVDHVRDAIILIFVAFPPGMTESQLIKNVTYHQLVMVMKSTDLGRTWSIPVDITASTLNAMRRIPSMFATGPGHGIQLKSGRLIAQGNVHVKKVPGGKFTYDFSTVIYSDDGGSTWSPGGTVPLGWDSFENIIMTNEATVVELDNNLLCLNSRTPNAFQTRAISCSKNGGLQFGLPQLSDNLVESGFKMRNGNLHLLKNPGCEGSMVAFPAPPGTNITDDVHKTWVLFSNPANMADRTRLSVRLSTNSLKTWSEPWRLHEGSSGYSDLAYYETIENRKKVQNFAILYEIGTNEMSEISFRTFTLQDVIRNIPLSL
ncbi:sialidase-2-like [Saccoglossus kowalevskii]|uniref:Sialidase-3-like n=1 Tax=Saccoglossus kowalevskii TaxID=10224 RepID=A0ABM0M1D8_SACKO|nr:PREDICTED: sialidase-3-like [Saccoglossus kowalevskii]